MADHVHMLVSTPPKYNYSNFTGYLNRKSLLIFDKHANLKYINMGIGSLGRKDIM